jgi:hypothetical protein
VFQYITKWDVFFCTKSYGKLKAENKIPVYNGRENFFNVIFSVKKYLGKLTWKLMFQYP